MTIPTMITIKAAAEKTGLSYDAIRKMCLRKEIVFIQVGKKRLINMERFIEYLNGKETEEVEQNGSA